jgi:hypothetical protein
MLCADLVAIDVAEASGRVHREIANLEDISASGACIQLDRPIPLRTRLTITFERGELSGVVRYCIFQEIGYFIGLEFEPGSRWSQESFRPRHLLDPRTLK